MQINLYLFSNQTQSSLFSEKKRQGSKSPVGRRNNDCLRRESSVYVRSCRLLCINSVWIRRPHSWRRATSLSRESSASTEELLMENRVEVWKIRWHARNRLKFTRGNAGWTAAIAHGTYLPSPQRAANRLSETVESFVKAENHANEIYSNFIFFRLSNADGWFKASIRLHLIKY